MSEKTAKKLRKGKQELSDFIVNEHNIDEVLSKLSKSTTVGDDPRFIVIDLFCGAGGTSEGFLQALIDDKKIAKVIACVNHDFTAIKSHWRNNPEVLHFEEDIRTLNVNVIKKVVDYYKSLYPDAIVILWASLECTNFSKAKGGQPRDADSRTLAESLYRVWVPDQSDTTGKKGTYVDGESYIQLLQPDYVMIENVVEFMAWGPMRIASTKTHKDRSDLKIFRNKNTGKKEYAWIPSSKKNGQSFLKWKKDINNFGYRDEWKELNSANFGAYTSRNRLFGCFAKEGLPIVWPQATHAKNPSKHSMFGDFKKWKAVKEVLNFEDEGESIFNDLFERSEKQAKNYLHQVPKKEKGKSEGKPVNKTVVLFPASVKNPVFGMSPKVVINYNQRNEFDAIVSGFRNIYKEVKFYRYDPYSDATNERVYAGLIKYVANGDTRFISKYYSGNPSGKNITTEGPAGTITTIDSQALVQPKFLLKYNSCGKNGKHTPPSIEDPCPVISTQGRLGIVQPEFLMQSNGGKPSAKVTSVEDPSRVITTSPNQALVQPEFLTSYYGNGDNLSSIDGPCPTLTTKDRVAVVQPKYLINYNHSSKINDINEAAPTLVTRDKLGLVQAEFFIDKHFGKYAQNQSINQPAGSILPTDKHRLVECVSFIVNPSHGGHCTSTEAPGPVIVARQDKAPLSFVQVERGKVTIAVFESDSPILIKIKQFMAIYGIVDIKMRMLRIPELLLIQGFPKKYKLEGNQSEQKKFIGNSVVPQVVKCWVEVMGIKLIESQTKVA